MRVVIREAWLPIRGTAGDEVDDGFLIREPDRNTAEVVLVGHEIILSAGESRGQNKGTANEIRGYKKGTANEIRGYKLDSLCRVLYSIRLMLAKRIIPCLDVDRGRVVKGTKFLNLRDAGDPVECAKEYDRQGADELVFLDITASSDNRATMIDVVERTANECFMPLTVGGGIRTVDDIRGMLKAGADKTSLNTAAVQNPDVVRAGAERFGSQCIVVAIDAKRRVERGAKSEERSSFAKATEDNEGASAAPRWEVYTHGGRKPTGIDAVEWARKVEALGAGEILLTSMDADGTKAGYDVALTRAISEAVHIPVIASGGAGSLDHMAEVLIDGKADAVLAASIFHFGEYQVADVKEFLKNKGICVRI